MFGNIMKTLAIEFKFHDELDSICNPADKRFHHLPHVCQVCSTSLQDPHV